MKNNIKITLEDRDRKALIYLGSKVLSLEQDGSNFNFIITQYKQIAKELDQMSLYSIRRYADVLARAVRKIKQQDKSDENSSIKNTFKLYEKKYRLVSNEASRMIRNMKKHHHDKKTKLIMTPGNVFGKIDEIVKSRQTNKCNEISEIDEKNVSIMNMN